MPTEQALCFAQAHLVESVTQLQDMVCFASAEQSLSLRPFLAGLTHTKLSTHTSAVWQKGLRTARQLANLRESTLLSCGLPEVHIDAIQARAVITDMLLPYCTVC